MIPANDPERSAKRGKEHNRGGAAGPLTRMTRDLAQPGTGRRDQFIAMGKAQCKTCKK
jgi:hypothetical protein